MGGTSRSLLLVVHTVATNGAMPSLLWVHCSDGVVATCTLLLLQCLKDLHAHKEMACNRMRDWQSEAHAGTCSVTRRMAKRDHIQESMQGSGVWCGPRNDVRVGQVNLAAWAKTKFGRSWSYPRKTVAGNRVAVLVSIESIAMSQLGFRE
jgi:hypothetical protein